MTETREQLGHFLRTRRERLRPEQLGLAPTPRRRAAGLRREEVAQLAGISAEWYVKLEQGRGAAPSHATTDALARALRLDEAERAHLRLLARENRRPAFAPEQVPPPLRRLVDGIGHPAFVTGRRWDILVWNEAAADLFTDLARLPCDCRNILRYMLTDGRARALFGEAWAAEARRMIALFRPVHDLWANDPAFAGLVRELRGACPEFDRWWTTHDIGSAVSGTKTLHHPDRGTLRYDYTTLQANDDPALRLSVLLPRT